MSTSERRNLYFINKNFSKNIHLKNIDIILSPEFYWVKSVYLPNISQREVKKMAPSILEEYMPNGIYEYKVSKIDDDKDRYILLAYNLKDIFSKLESIGIEKSQINKIYLAQTEFENEDELSVKIDNNTSLISQDKIILTMPSKIIKTDTNIDELINNHKPTSNYIYSKKFQNINLDQKIYSTVISMLILLLVYLLVDAFYAKREIDKIREKKSILISKYNLPRTKMQLKSITKEFESIDKKQTSLRETIYHLNNFRLKPQETFNNFYISNNKIKFSIYFTNEKRAKDFINYISNYINMIQKRFSNNVLYVEVAI